MRELLRIAARFEPLDRMCGAPIWRSGKLLGTDVMAQLVNDGMLLQSAKGRISNVADLVAGEAIEGSWWGSSVGGEISRPCYMKCTPSPGRLVVIGTRIG